MTVGLAIDTATDVGSVAVAVDGVVLGETLLTSRRHASGLLPAAIALLDGVGRRLSHVTDVIVADGPGSFTGLRIAWATAHGLACAQPAARVWAVPSSAVAARVGRRLGGAVIAVLYDALRGEVFGALYRVEDGAIETLLPPHVTTLAALEAAAPRQPDLAVGDGAWRWAAAVRAWVGRDPLPPAVAGPRASAVFEIPNGSPLLRPVPVVSRFEPTYGRLAEAQVRWERAHGRSLPHSSGDAR